MKKILYKPMCLFALSILIFGNYTNASALLAPIAAQSSNIYYVSTAGNDANTGIETAPWKTIQKAVNAANPGDTILVRAGTYNENIIITRSGSSGNVIKLTNYPNEVVEINGGSGMALRTSGAIGYWTIEGMRFKSTNQFAIRFGWFHEAITNHMTLRNNYINGTVFTVGNNQLFEDNEIDGAGYAASGGYGGINDSHGGLGDNATHHNAYRRNFIHDFTNYNARGIWTQGRTHDSIIESNRIENIWTTGLGQCIDLDAGQTGLVQWRHVVKNNIVMDCNYAGIQLENVFDSLVENNLVKAEKGGSAGIIVINYSPSVGCGVGGENNQYGDTNGDNSCKGDITNNIIRQNIITKRGSWGWGYGGIVNWGAGGLQILGNTIYASGSSGNAAINFQAPAAETSQSIIQNNILYNANGPAICALSFSSFIQDSNNLLYKTTSNGDGVYGSGKSCAQAYSLSSYKTATGKGENSVQSEPQFISVTDYNFHLSSSSPAIDKGLNIGLKTDFDGNPRPQGNGFDIGAFEFLGINTVTFTPIVTETPVITGTPVMTATPVTSNTPIVTGTPTSTNTPASISTALPTGPYITTVVTPQSLILGELGLVTVSLNNVPPEGYKSAEFTCTYTPDLIEISNISITDLFGADPVSALNGPQNGSFIVAIAGSNDNKAMTSGTVFTFNATGLQVGQTGIECKARISKGDGILENILSIPDTLTILGNSPTATPIAAPLLTGQVLANKPVTIRLFNPDASLAATTTANADGTFSLTAPAGVYTVIASAEGHLDSQGPATLVDGVNTTMPVVSLPAGDIDNNDVIDQFDAMTLGMNYNISAPAATELNNDGVTNILDLEMLAENYRKSGALAWQ